MGLIIIIGGVCALLTIKYRLDGGLRSVMGSENSLIGGVKKHRSFFLFLGWLFALSF